VQCNKPGAFGIQRMSLQIERSLGVLALLRSVLSPSHLKIEPRARVNRVQTLIGPERIDGLVINVNQGVAYVAWPNGDTTMESTKHLVPIIA
jgi:hypothetical protein